MNERSQAFSHRLEVLVQRVTLVSILVFLGVLGIYQKGPVAGMTVPSRADNKALVKQSDKANLSKHGENPDMWMRSGVLADKKAKRIVLLGEATGLSAKGEPPEFFLIAEHSGHDYEALAIVFAMPSHVHEALQFIGMKPGRPVNEKNLEFWPKGERVFVTFACKTVSPAIGPVRMETLFLDAKTGKPSPSMGLVFTGSVQVDAMQETDWKKTKEPSKEAVKGPRKKVYAADVMDPHSIAANYNERGTVLDVPRQAPQNDVYRHQTVNPKYVFPKGALLEIVIEPEYKNDKKRVMELILCAGAAGQLPAQGLADIRFTLTGPTGKELKKKAKLNDVLKSFTEFVEKGHDPFVTLQFDDDLTLQAVHDLCKLFSSIETEKGIRVEPPPTDHLYYRAFIPDEANRPREKRLYQPWELRLSVQDNNVTGILTQIEEEWVDGKLKPNLKPQDYAVSTSKALREELDKRGPGLPVILVFARPDVTHGQLMAFLKPALSTHPLVHVYLEGK